MTSVTVGLLKEVGLQILLENSQWWHRDDRKWQVVPDTSVGNSKRMITDGVEPRPRHRPLVCRCRSKALLSHHQRPSVGRWPGTLVQCGYSNEKRVLRPVNTWCNLAAHATSEGPKAMKTRDRTCMIGSPDVLQHEVLTEVDLVSGMLASAAMP